MPRKGLDILGQKSWHVLRRHNIERVRKDQREERERIEKEKEREEKALFESQIQQLRNKSGAQSDLPKESINLFKIDDLTELKNADKEKEDQQEKDAQDRKEGFLTYVGESVLENETPWYATHRDIEREADKEKITKDLMRKETEDPFDAKFKKSMSWANAEKSSKDSSEYLRILPSYYEDNQIKKSKKSKKEKKEKKSKKKRKRRHSSPQSSSEVSSHEYGHAQRGLAEYVAPPSMDELRARKQKREEREKLKTQELMDRVNGVVREKPKEVEEESDERKRKYNSAFNPNLNRHSESKRHR